MHITHTLNILIAKNQQRFQCIFFSLYGRYLVYEITKGNSPVSIEATVYVNKFNSCYLGAEGKQNMSSGRHDI